jgi:hypothetical protein
MPALVWRNWGIRRAISLRIVNVLASNRASFEYRLQTLWRPHTNCVKTTIKASEKREKSLRQYHDSDWCVAVFIISFISTVLLFCVMSQTSCLDCYMFWRMPMCGLPYLIWNMIVVWWLFKYIENLRREIFNTDQSVASFTRLIYCKESVRSSTRNTRRYESNRRKSNSWC